VTTRINETDYADADRVEVVVIGDDLWVNIDGKNAFRVKRMSQLSFTVNRYSKAPKDGPA
jgi:hypothetical protein